VCGYLKVAEVDAGVGEDTFDSRLAVTASTRGRLGAGHVARTFDAGFGGDFRVGGSPGGG